MISVTLAVLALPLVAMLWSLIGIARDRSRLTRHHVFSLFGAFLLLPLGICYLGFMEMGLTWLTSLSGVAFGTTALVGAAIFTRSETGNHRRRRIPAWACPQCNYDRRAGPAGPCPECGLSQPIRP